MPWWKLIGCVSVICQLTSAFAQDCRIAYAQNTREQLRDNRVKEIKIYLHGQQDFSSGGNGLVDYYIIDENGCAKKYIRYDQNTGESRTQTVQTVSNDGLVKTFTFGRMVKEGFELLYERETTHYTPSDKLLKRVNEKFYDFHVVTTNLYDTSNYEAINQTTVKIHSPNDTLQIIRLVKNSEREVRTVTDKVNGVLIETEKSVSKFKDGKLDEYVMYHYGKVVQQYKDAEADELEPMTYIEQENENALPYVEPSADTIFTNDLVDYKPAKKSSAKYKAIIHYEDTEKKISYIDVLHAKSGLMYRKLFEKNKDVYEAYEYVFYGN